MRSAYTMDIKNDLQEIFRDIFDDETMELTNALCADDVEDWDSLSHIRLIVAIEKQFHIKFSFGEMKNLENVGEMIELIEYKIKD